MRKIAILTSILALTLGACGGGGGSGSSGPGITGGGGSGSGSSDPTWTPGVFAASTTFKDRCAAPRAGTNDRAGSTLFENHWLRSWSDETYLWYSEITDRDPAEFTDPLDYFEVLKTEATTASGAPRDKFHFTFDTEEYEQLVNSGASAGYGSRFRLLDTTAPDREAVIAFVEAGSPAAAVGLTRGTQIISVDGAAIADGDAATLNAGLFPEGAGETHTFVVRDLGSTTNREVTITSDIVTANPVHTTDVSTLGNGDRVGYVAFNTFGTSIAEEAIFDAFTDFSNQNVDHLVLDLRYNGGGFLAISSELGYMIAGPSATNGRTYETLVFNDKNPTTNPVTGETLRPTPFYSTARGFSVAEGTPLPTLNLDKVYVLSTSSTCSASESLINSLEGINVEVVMIGSTTCGKPYGFYATDNCGTTYFTIQFRGENDKGFGDYSDGFSPSEGGATTGEPIDGCIIDDDFTSLLGDPNEAMFGAALTHLQTGSCPTNAVASSKTQSFVNYEAPVSFEDGNLLEDPRIKRRNFLESNRILNGPNDQ